MTLHRPALLIAALAATLSVAHVAAEEISAQQFMIEENKRAQANQSAQSAEDPVVAGDNNEQQPKKNTNPWKGLRMVSASPLTLDIAAHTSATSASINNAEIVALIDKHAAANGLSAAFARAVVRIESNYNPRVTGLAGEVGLMQIKYETARGIGYTGTRADLYNPDTNLQWGMKYLAMSWKLGGNTPCGAVLKYQAGHGATQPTAASRVYCAKVNAHMASN